MNIHLQDSIKGYREKIALLKEHSRKKAYFNPYRGLCLAKGQEFLLCLGKKGCALCTQYINDNCENCPVFEKTGWVSCMTTPWEDIWEHCQKKNFFITKKFINLFEKELAFLEGLQSE